MTLTSRPSLLLSVIVWLIITLAGIYFIFNINKHLNLGLDLVGGTYLTLEVEVDKVIKTELEDTLQTVTKYLQESQKELPVSSRIEEDKALLIFKTEQAATDAYEIATAYNQRLQKSGSIKLLVITQEAARLTLTFTAPALRAIKQESVEGNMQVLKTRLDATSLSDVTIAKQGEKYIIVELPNVNNIEEAKRRIGKTALLEFKPVYDSAFTEEKILEKHGGILPEGTVIIAGLPEEKTKELFYLVPSYAEVTGRLLTDARYQSDPDQVFKGKNHTPHTVSFSLKPEGEDKFFELTSNNIGGQIAIIMDNIVITAPSIQEPIKLRGGYAQITGSRDKKDAQELALLLKSGSFVAPVKFAEERHIGPSLGKESIRKGLLSCAIGLALLFVFSVSVYKVAGLFAFIVLLYNLLLILFGLSSFNATLTLPGIAGMVLTIGMAIDASILIFERIKEEIALGVPMRKAVDAGFAGATTVILDANITHFIVSIVLYWLGTGPIQGFAVTMIIGILSTLITGLLLLRTIFNFTFDVLGRQNIKI